MPDCVLGLDGGGTKTHAVLLGQDRAVQGEGRGGPCSISAVSVSEALEGVRAASEQACFHAGKAWEDISAVCVGVAGYSQRPRRAEFTVGLQALFPGRLVQVEPDYGVALWGATGGGPGIIVISGTGSVSYGENALGENHRAGAYGYLIDDAGSGYGVGRAALAAVLRASDGTGEPTALTGALLGHLGMDSVADIVPAVYGGPLERVAIAGLASVVAETANTAADSVAQAILMRAGGALARLTEAVAVRLFPETNVSYPVAPVGSLWNAGSVLTDVFDRSLARFAPSAVRVPPRLSPAHGAALRAVDLNFGNVLQ
jgi:N-acetylglucosamine kinase-like BadF-type ATPase